MPKVKKNAPTFQTLTANHSGMVRNETLEGREYKVVPMVMIVEGVLNGTNGPLYYPAEEMAKVPQVWNHKPVVVYHPQMNGKALSACDPEVIENYKVGLIMNTEFDGKRLKAEAWLEPGRIEAVDNRVGEALDAQEVMELSTGLFTENEYTEGEFDGKAYIGIARNFRPDHLALLPDQKGACSVADGAGLLVNKAADEDDGPQALLARSLLATFNELSHSDIWKQLNDKIRGNVVGDAPMDVWVVEVWDDFFIYEKDGKTYYQEYMVDDEDGVKLEGVRKEAMKKTSYQLVDGTIVGNNNEDGNAAKAAKKPSVLRNQNRKDEDMKDREKLVDDLIANSESPWTEDDREMLTGLSDDKFKVIANQEAKEEPPAGDPPASKEEPTGNKAPVTVDSFVANAPPEVQDVLRSGIVAHNREKAGLIKVITANERCTFTEEQLSKKPLEELQQLAALATEPTDNQTPAPPNYLGQGEVKPTNNQEREALTAPTLNFGNDEE